MQSASHPASRADAAVVVLAALVLGAGLLPWWRSDVGHADPSGSGTWHLTIDGYRAATAWTVALVLVAAAGLLWVLSRRVPGRSVARWAALAAALAALAVTAAYWVHVGAPYTPTRVRVVARVLRPGEALFTGPGAYAPRRDGLRVLHAPGYSSGPAFGLPLAVLLMSLLCAAMVTSLVLRGRSRPGASRGR